MYIVDTMQSQFSLLAICLYEQFDASHINFAGCSGLGKSTLVNTLFKTRAARTSCSSESVSIPKTVEIKTVTHGKFTWLMLTSCCRVRPIYIFLILNKFQDILTVSQLFVVIRFFSYLVVMQLGQVKLCLCWLYIKINRGFILANIKHVEVIFKK